jgi:hypothetical protein
MFMKRMSMVKKRWLIVIATVVIAFGGWLLFEPIADKWVLAVLIVGCLVEWYAIRCPRCGRHMGWWDRGFCSLCKQKDKIEEAKNGR